jgi:hypothetical protein
MTDKTRSVTRRRRRRTLLVPLLTVGVAAWVVRRRLDVRHGLDAGWRPLPPALHPLPLAPSRVAVPTPPAPPVEPVAAVREPAASVREPTAAVRRPGPVAEAAPRARAVPTAVAPIATVAAPARPDVPGAVASLDDGSAPDPAYVIKGKVATKTFHTPGGAYYTRTRADVWFRTARDARAAGFTERVRRHS